MSCVVRLVCCFNTYCVRSFFHWFELLISQTQKKFSILLFSFSLLFPHYTPVFYVFFIKITSILSNTYKIEVFFVILPYYHPHTHTLLFKLSQKVVKLKYLLTTYTHTNTHPTLQRYEHYRCSNLQVYLTVQHGRRWC